MQKFKKKKMFQAFFEKDFSFHSQQSQNNFETISKISGKQKYSIVFLNAKKKDIDESIFLNFPFDKSRLKSIVCWFFEKYGQYKTLKFLEKLKEVGFSSATNAGISLGIDDLKIPNQKITLVSTAETKVAKDLLHYRNAQMTGIERIQRLIYIWNQTNDTLKQEVVRLFETTDLLNPIYMMAFSGARGNMSQVRQLVGMRGLMSDPQGQIIDFPIQSNFREGLTLTEYLISTYGARKGIVDTALRTATAGYLTRRLVDVAQHTIVSKFDCGTMRGIFLFDMKDGKKTIYSFQNRLIGRVLAQNIEFFEKKNQNGDFVKKQIAFRNQEIDSKFAQAISKVTKKAFVRSPLTCETSRFVCQLCYGWSFSHGKLVSIGEAVGIIAAQSIGEPGTQLTMRTFHTGGVFAGGLTDQILAPFHGKIKYFQNIPGTCVRNSLSEIAFFTKMPGSFIVEKSSAHSSFFDKKRKSQISKTRRKSGEILRIPAYALLFCRNNESVRKKQVLAQFSSVLKKMQYGQAEQTLYSTFAGEFVFGKSFFPPSKRNSDFSFPSSQFQTLSGNPTPKVPKNFKSIGEQSLLLEKRRTGDFSEVELKNDILWKSQNWTTIWILSGNIFCDSLNTNFYFREGDCFKKTSVIQRILWAKKKNYKYSLIENKKIEKKVQKNIEYLFALEKKKFYTSFFSNFPFVSQKLKLFSRKHSLKEFFADGKWIFSKQKMFSGKKDFFKRKNIQTNFFISSFHFFPVSTFFKAKKIFSYCTSIFSNPFLNIQKNNDFVFLQNKSNRFFTDFEKITLSFHPDFEEKKEKISKKEKDKVQKHIFFKFLNKRKNFHYPLFLNISTFLQTFQISQKFQFFSSIHEFSKIQFENFHLSPLFFCEAKKFRAKKMTFSFIHSYQKTSFIQSKLGKASKDFNFSKSLSFFESSHKQKERNKKVFQTSFSGEDSLFSSLFANHYVFQKKNNAQLEKKRKTILLKTYLFRFPITKISYQKYGYFSSFFTFFNTKKMKNSFQTFSTLTQKESFLNGQRNIGKRENLFSNENFFGKDVPNSFSYCFFENSFRSTGGIFYLSFFEHSSKKQRISYFLCQDFFLCNTGHEEKKCISLKTELLEKRRDTKMKKQILFLYAENLLNFSNFVNTNDNTKKSKKFFFSPESNPIFIFQIPTFSYLSISKNFFLNPFFKVQNSIHGKTPQFFFKQQPFLQSIEEIKKNSFQNKERKFFSSSAIHSDKNKSKLFYSSLFSENGNLSKRIQNASNLKNSQLKMNRNEFPGNGNGSKKNGDESYFPIGSKKPSSKNNRVDSSRNSWEGKDYFPIVVSLYNFFFLKQETIKNEHDIFEKNIKIQFFDFSRNFLENKGEEIKQKKFKFLEKKKSFILHNFSLNQLDESSKNSIFLKDKKQKTNFFDFYVKEISWLPQENFIIFASQILKKKTFFPASDFFSGSQKNPFLFFVNRQGKKKFFCFESGFLKSEENFINNLCQNKTSQFSNTIFHSKLQHQKLFSTEFRKSSFQSFEKKNFNFEKTQENQGKNKIVFEGFVKLSNIKTFQNFLFFGQKKKKKMKTFFPLSQKFSFYPFHRKKKFLKKTFLQIVTQNKISSSHDIFLANPKKRGKNKFLSKKVQKRKNAFQKNISYKFQKRIGNKKFANIQKFFLKKSSFFPENLFKNDTFSKKFSKTQAFFGKNLESQCFSCVPFQKISSSLKLKKKKHNAMSQKLKNFQNVQQNFRAKQFLKNNKLQFKIEQGWLVFPFSFKDSFFDAHKKKIKKGQFFEKNLTFEQNNIFLEMVVFEQAKVFLEQDTNFQKTRISQIKSQISFSNSINNCGIQTEKISFQVDFLQTNKKCRYISLDFPLHFKNTEKSINIEELSVENFGVHDIFLAKQKKREKKYSSKMPFQHSFCFDKITKPIHKNLSTQVKKQTLMQFFRPFQYKILENPQNLKSFFQNIRVQSFSEIVSSSWFQLSKKYHSFLLNHQKKTKRFFEKHSNSDFEIGSNFQNMYFFKDSSPFLSFSKQTEKRTIKKNFLQKFKFQNIEEEKNEGLKKGIEFQNSFQNLKNHKPLSSYETSPIFEESTEFYGGESFLDFFALQKKSGAKFLNLDHGEEKNSTKGKKNFFFHFGKDKENISNFSFYPVQFLPLVLSFSKNSFQPFFSHSSFPIFSINALKNTIEFQMCEKRAAFFDERFSFGNHFDFPQTSSFWLNKDTLNFLFFPDFGFTKPKKMSMNLNSISSIQSSKKLIFNNFQKVSLTNSRNFIQNSVFQKNKNFYGSTEFFSPYEGEILPLFTHNLYWWKKASEISTLQKFEKFFTVVTKKDLFTVEFPFETKNTKKISFSSFPNQENFQEWDEKNEKSQKNEDFARIDTGFENGSFSNRKVFNVLKQKQKHLQKLYTILSKKYQIKKFLTCFKEEKEKFIDNDSSTFKRNSQECFSDFESQNQKKTKISSFVTKYDNKIFTFQNLTVGYPSLFKKPFLGNFVVYGDNFFGSSIQNPGQIIHLSFSSMTLRHGQPYLVSANGILHFSNIPYIQKDVPLVTLPYQTVQAGDIVQGIPKVEQFFEARTSLQGRLFVSSLPILLKGIFERYKVLLPLEQATRQSFLKIQQIIVDGVQRVYRSQGVSITDKHLEVVVRQMTTKVQILHGAQTGFFPGELVNLDLVERINKFLMVKIRYEPVILGITRASLEVDSFLSASSFQQTTKILSLAAISRKKDFLKGLKENLLVGNLIPSGTGYFHLSKKI